MDYNKIQGQFPDISDGSVDFHSFWHSICHLLGIAENFSNKLTDIRSNDMLLRVFLSSRNIYYKTNSTIEDLQFLYDNYLSQIEYRGTYQPFTKRGIKSEIGLSPNEDQSFGIAYKHSSYDNTFGTLLNLGVEHEIRFNVLFQEGESKISFNNGKLFSGPNSWVKLIDGVSVGGNIFEYQLEYKIVTGLVNFTFNLDISSIHEFKIFRYNEFVVLFIDNEFIGSNQLVSSYAFVSNKLFDGNLPITWDIGVISFNNSIPVQSYGWGCKEGSGFVIESDNPPIRSCYLTVDASIQNSVLWKRDQRMDSDYNEIDGEVIRLLNHTSGEYIASKFNSSEFGLTIDVSSFISEENKIFDANKFYERSIIKRMSRFPLNFTSDIRPTLSDPVDGESFSYNLPQSNTDFFGINANLIGSMTILTNNLFKPNGLIPILPINIVQKQDKFDGYEFSFSLKVDSECKLRFGLLCTDNNLYPKPGGTKRYTDNVNSQFLIEDDSFLLTVDTFINIRGIVSIGVLSDALLTTNIGVGSNLYFSVDNLYFCFPIIGVCNTLGNELQFTIKDFVFRPLSLPTSQCVLDKQDGVLLVTKNLSTLSDKKLNKILEEDFLPYNYNILSQYI